MLYHKRQSTDLAVISSNIAVFTITSQTKESSRNNSPMQLTTQDSHKIFLETLFQITQPLPEGEILQLRQERDTAYQERKLRRIRCDLQRYNSNMLRYTELLEAGLLNRTIHRSVELRIWLNSRCTRH